MKTPGYHIGVWATMGKPTNYGLTLTLLGNILVIDIVILIVCSILAWVGVM